MRIIGYFNTHIVIRFLLLAILIGLLLPSSGCKKSEKPIDYSEAKVLSRKALQECAMSDGLNPHDFILAEVRTNNELRNTNGELAVEFFPWVFTYQSDAKPNYTAVVYVTNSGVTKTSTWFANDSTSKDESYGDEL